MIYEDRALGNVGGIIIIQLRFIDRFGEKPISIVYMWSRSGGLISWESAMVIRDLRERRMFEIAVRKCGDAFRLA